MGLIIFRGPHRKGITFGPPCASLPGEVLKLETRFLVLWRRWANQAGRVVYVAKRLEKNRRRSSFFWKGWKVSYESSFNVFFLPWKIFSVVSMFSDFSVALNTTKTHGPGAFPFLKKGGIKFWMFGGFCQLNDGWKETLDCNWPLLSWALEMIPSKTSGSISLLSRRISSRGHDRKTMGFWCLSRRKRPQTAWFQWCTTVV